VAVPLRFLGEWILVIIAAYYKDSPFLGSLLYSIQPMLFPDSIFAGKIGLAWTKVSLFVIDIAPA